MRAREPVQLRVEAAKHGVTVGIQGSRAFDKASCVAYLAAYLASQGNHMAKGPSQSQSRSSPGLQSRTCCFGGRDQVVDGDDSSAGAASRLESSLPGLRAREGRTGCCVLAGQLRKGCLAMRIRTDHAGVLTLEPAPGTDRRSSGLEPSTVGNY